MCRVKVTGFEVRLAANQGAGHTAHVRKRSEVGRAIKQLTDSTSATDPVSCGQSVHDLLSQDIGSKTCIDSKFSLSVVMTFKLIFQITSELLHADSIEIFDEVPSEPDALVRIVVLVIRISVGNRHFENLADDSSEEDCFLLTIVLGGPKVRKEFLIEEILNSRFSVFLLLTRCELLLKPLHRLLGTLDTIFLIVLDIVDIRDGVFHRLDWASNCSENLLVILHTECPHQQDDWYRGGPSAGNLHHQHPIAALLDIQGLSNTILL